MTADRPQPLASRRILVVDDQPSIRGILEAALADAGAEVWTAENGSSALLSIESRLPDLILLDLVMPEMDGWSVIDALRASPRTARVPVALQTSAEEFATFDRARSHGVAAFISKPFRLGEVIETCRRILDGARPLQGKPARGEGGAAVRVHDLAGNFLASGLLLELAPPGAQVDLDGPLPLASSVSLSLSEGEKMITANAEVRWLTRVGNRYHHGLLIHSGGIEPV